MAVSTPSQASQVGEHPTRKAVPRQLDFTTIIGGPAPSPDKSTRPTPPSLYGTSFCVHDPSFIYSFFHACPLVFFSRVSVRRITDKNVSRCGVNSYCLFPRLVRYRYSQVVCYANPICMCLRYWWAGSTGLRGSGQGPSIQKMARQRSASNVTVKILAV